MSEINPATEARRRPIVKLDNGGRAYLAIGFVLPLSFATGSLLAGAGFPYAFGLLARDLMLPSFAYGIVLWRSRSHNAAARWFFWVSAAWILLTRGHIQSASSSEQ